jgi:hypothetical protein
MFIGLVAIQCVEGISRQAQRFGKGAQHDGHLGHRFCQSSNVVFSSGCSAGHSSALQAPPARVAVAQQQFRAFRADIELFSPVWFTTGDFRCRAVVAAKMESSPPAVFAHR